MYLLRNQIIMFKTLFKRNKSGKKPDIYGETLIECPFCKKKAQYQVVLWGKTTVDGRSYLKGYCNAFDEDDNYIRIKRLQDKRFRRSMKVDIGKRKDPF